MRLLHAVILLLVSGHSALAASSVSGERDAVRTLYVSTAVKVNGDTTQTLFPMSVCRNGICGADATSHSVATGKTLRLTTLTLTWRNATAAVGGALVRCRINPNGAVTGASMIFATMNATVSLATIGAGDTVSINFHGGLDIPGGQQWGCTQLAIGTVTGFDFNAVGFEY